MNTLNWKQRSDQWYMATGNGATYHARFDPATTEWVLTVQPVASDTHTTIETSPKLHYLMNLAEWTMNNAELIR